MKVEKIKFIDSLIYKDLKIDLVVTTKKIRVKYTANIINFDENYIYVSAPIKNDKIILLPHKSKVEATFINKFGKFILKSYVYNKNNRAERYVCIVRPKNLYLLQQREFFRIDIREKVNFYILRTTKSDNLIVFNKKNCSGFLVDISAGGCRIESKVGLKVNDIIELDLRRLISDLSSVIGKVVKIYTDNNKVSYGIQFLSIKDKDRDKIVRFGLQEQIKMSKLVQ
ncbi:MAG: flagellar brake protein [Deferribacterota bacterium]|nr:flagellar brake protein [Deferribacterota bacterium]